MTARKLFIVITLAGCLRGPARAQEPATFLEARNFGSGLALALATGDFNRDGVPDVATVGNEITIYLGDGHGSFNIQPPIGLGGSSIVAADFNGDGALDLAVAAGDAILILLGNGDGTFRAPVSYAAVVSVLAVGDFNGDGIADLAALGSPFAANGQVQVFFGSAGGALQPGPVTLLPSAVAAPYAAVSADFDRDGKADLALGYQVYLAMGEVAVLAGHGDGTFGSPVIYQAATGVQFVFALVTADFNGDGAPDLAYAGYGEGAFTGTVGVLLNSGSGSFVPLPAITLRAAFNALATADLNGDGIADLMAGGYDAAVFLGRGDGTFRLHGQYVLGYAVNAVAIADFNGDGVPDVVSAGGVSNPSAAPKQPPLTLLLGTGGGRFRSSGAFEGVPYPTAIAVADFNHDGKLDIAVSNFNTSFSGLPGSPSIWVSLGDGNGRLSAPVKYPAGDPTALTAGDVNGDGNPDIVFAGRGRIATLPGNGDGTFGKAITSACPGCGNAAARGLQSRRQAGCGHLWK